MESAAKDNATDDSQSASTDKAEKPPPCPGEPGCISWPWTVVLTVVIVVMTGFVLFGIWQFWPEVAEAADAAESGATSGDSGEVTVWYFRNFLVSLEVQLLILVALAGALGSLLHGLRSLSKYIGEEKLKWNWAPFYLLLPFVGAVLGTILYLVFRGGLFSGEASAIAVNKFGMPAVAALAGLFTTQALEKLKKVGESVFERVEPGKDAVVEQSQETKRPT